MTLHTLPKRGWRLALVGGVAALLAAAPFVWAGSVGVRGLPREAGKVQPVRASWRQIGTTALPGPGAMVAGALLLMPFALSTLRIRRKERGG